MESPHRNAHHIFFFIVVCLLIFFVLTSTSPQSTVTAGQNTIKEASGMVCCTFLVGGKEKTCAVVDGQTCDACKTICQAYQ